MSWSGHSTRKQSDKKMNNAAELAQKWLQKGFAPQVVAEGIRNRIGYTTDVKNGIVRFHGCYSDEYKSWKGNRQFQFYVMREITADTITTPQDKIY